MEVFDLFLTSGEAKIVKNFCKTNNFYPLVELKS